MTTDKTRAKRKQKPKLLKPGMLMLAAMFLWSAQHEPPAFSLASVAIWLSGAVTIALLARAALALASPVLNIAGALLHQAFQGQNSGAEQ
ncbi:MAG TPA: hypothetical protein VMV54_01130 [Acidocella sp.]|nr:hypothetical protein [Acidocella sp.]